MPSKYPSRTEVVTAMKNRSCYLSPELLSGELLNKSRNFYYSGGYSTVFPFIKGNGEKIAVRCWTADIYKAKERTDAISRLISKLKSPYFVNHSYVDQALVINKELHPIIIMDWADGKPLLDFIDDNINNPSIINDLADNFRKMVEYFHKCKISHGDLQHGNILIKKDKEIVLVDYDSMYVEELKGFPDFIKGKQEYQHPRRKANTSLNAHLDYFSELIIYLSLTALADDKTIWRPDSDTLLFNTEDLDKPLLSKTIIKLTKSKNEKILFLTQKLIIFLGALDIVQLQPLKSVLTQFFGFKYGKLVDDISSKF